MLRNNLVNLLLLCYIHYILVLRGNSPGSLPSDTWLTLPPRKPTTCLAASISSSLAPTPRQTNRALGDFSTNTSLVFRLEAEASTWGNTRRQMRGGIQKCLQCPIRMWQQHRSMYWQTAHLHSPRSAGRALPDVEEASAAGQRLSTFAWRSSAVDDHGFALEQAHQVWRLLALSHSHLWMKSLKQLHNEGWWWFSLYEPIWVWTISWFLGLSYCMLTI